MEATLLVCRDIEAAASTESRPPADISLTSLLEFTAGGAILLLDACGL